MKRVPKSSEVPISDYICRALYTASRAVTGLYRELLVDLGLTYPQYLVMRLLWQRGPLYVKNVAAALQLDYGTLSPMLKRLEAAGLIHRTRRTDDERSVEIALTANGEAMRAHAAAIPSQVATAVGLDEQATTELLSMLAYVTEAVNHAAAAAK